MVLEVYDLETLSNLFTYTGYSVYEKKYYQFVIHDSNNQAEELYNHLYRDSQMFQVGYNNENFDYPVLHYFLTNYEAKYKYMDGDYISTDLYRKAQEIITTEGYHSIPDYKKIILQYDLFLIWNYDDKSRSTSLKDLQFALRMDNVEEMPIHHSMFINKPEQIEEVLSYNKNDVKATVIFLFTSLGKTNYPLYKGKNVIDLRRQISEKYNISCRNWSDIRIGEELMLKLYSEEVNLDKSQLRKYNTKRYTIELAECIPSWVNIKRKEFKTLVDSISKSSIRVGVDKFKYSVIFHGIKIDYGLGGAHASIKPGVYESNEDYILYDMDVASLYPSVAKSLNIYPEHLGETFMELYSGFIIERLNEKKKPRESQDVTMIEAFKLLLNGVYGKTNEKHSFLYDPLYTYKTTIGGQLFISMWCERMVEVVPDLTFIQINTDGITIKVKRSDINKIKQVNDQLTKETTLVIEDAFYDKMVIRDVNNYIAVYEGSTREKEKIKLKGAFDNTPEYHKNHSMLIVPTALKEYYIYDIPIEETIRKGNIYDYCLRLKINNISSAERHIIEGTSYKTEKLNRTTRYYISNSGGGLVAYYNGSKEPNRIHIGFNTTIFNKYYDSDDYDINYDFYEIEARKIINIIEDKQLTLF